VITAVFPERSFIARDDIPDLGPNAAARGRVRRGVKDARPA
jgi:hypothetical protein